MVPISLTIEIQAIVPNFKLWHDPDPTNCTTKAKELHSANSQTQKNHSGNVEKVLGGKIPIGGRVLPGVDL